MRNVRMVIWVMVVLFTVLAVARSNLFGKPAEDTNLTIDLLALDWPSQLGPQFLVLCPWTAAHCPRIRIGSSVPMLGRAK